ncbi:hypothetical protein [Bacillus sp. RAR_GA_16]|nr:hypothetical protein [Bacillus sp. RAR_GA_16]
MAELWKERFIKQQDRKRYVKGSTAIGIAMICIVAGVKRVKRG